MLGGERLGGVKERQKSGAVRGLQAAPLGRAQAFLGELEIAKGLDALTSPVEAGLQAGTERTERRGAASLGTHYAERGFEELTSLGRALGQAIGAEQRLGLLSLELVTLHRLGHGLLVLGAEHTERVGQRRAESPLVDLALQRLTELLGHGEPHVDPAHLAATGLGDGLRPQLLLVPQGMDHAGLVHRRERARWPVGLEKGDHPLRRAAGLLHEDRHALQTELAPVPQALEAVDQLVGTTLGGHHPQRQRTERRLLATPLPAPAAQLLQARAQRAHRDPLEPGAPLRLGWRPAVQRDHRARRAHGSSPTVSRLRSGPSGGMASTWRKPSLACA